MSYDSPIDPLITPNSSAGYDAVTSNSSNPRIRPELDATLIQAANTIYEAVIEDDDEFNEEDHDEDALWLRQERLNHKTLYWFQRPSIILITALTFAFATAMGSGVSAKQIITLKLACNSQSLSTGQVCDATEVQIIASNLQMAYTLSANVAMLLVSAKICALSDQYGRKLFLALTMFMFFLGTLTKYLLMSNWDDLKFIPMVITETLANAGGGPVCLMAMANCYLADIVETHQRIFALGTGIASLFVGLSLGPLIGNLVLDLATKAVKSDSDDGASVFITIQSHEFAPLRFELVSLALCVVYAVFFLPESRSEKARRKSRTLSVTSMTSLRSQASQTYIQSTYSSIVSLFKPLKLLLLPEEALSRYADKSKIKEYRITVLFLIIADGFLVGLGATLGEIFVLYGFFKFNWKQQDLGKFMALVCSSKAIVLIVISPLINHKILQNRFKLKVNKHQFDLIDFTYCVIGFTCEALALILVFLVPSTFWFMAVMPILSFGALPLPTMASSIIKFYPESKVGEVYGAMALVKNMMGLTCPLALLAVYKFSLKHWGLPGFAFLACACIHISFLCMAFYVKHILKLTLTPALPEIYDETRSFSELHRKNSFVQRERMNEVPDLAQLKP